MSSHGGKRPGAGRKPAEQGLYKREVASARAIMGHALENLTSVLVDRGRGLFVLMALNNQGAWEMLPEGQARRVAEDPDYLASLLQANVARVFTLPPDRAAIALVMDRIMGKVPTVIELEYKRKFDALQSDHALIARVIREHVPDEYLAPVLAELERISRHRAAEDAQALGPVTA